MKRRKSKSRKIKPGYEKRIEIGQITVENPDSDPNCPQITVKINKRHDLLTWWHSRKAIDDAQFIAGKRFQSIWYRARIGGQGSLDPSKPFIDRSITSDHIQDHILDALQQLKILSSVLGQKDYSLLCHALCEGKTLSDLSLSYRGTKGDREYIGWRIRDALDALSHFWGARGKKYTPITAYHSINLQNEG